MSRPPLSKDSPSTRLHMKITTDEIDQINEWRFANRVETLSAAVRRLIAIGLAAEQSEAKP